IGAGGSDLPLSGGTMTGPILQADGTASAPSYSWSSDTATGFYRVGNGATGYSSNNSLTVQFGSSGLGVWPWGSATTPSVSLGTTSTGLFVPASNEIGFAT